MKSNRNQTRSGATFRNHQPSRGGDPRSIVRPTGEADDALFDIWFNDSCGQIIIERFRKNLKRRRDKMETEIRKDDEKTLDLILNKTKKPF